MKIPHRRNPDRFWMFSILFFAFGFSCLAAKAQTILTGGEIAFTGYKTGAVDTISFIILRENGIGASTSILFTDNGWMSSGVGRTGEGVMEWQASYALKYGEQVKIWSGNTTFGTDNGVLKAVSGRIDLSTAGDQIFAFQGSWPGAVRFIAGLHYNKTAKTTDAGWDNDSNPAAATSAYPSGLCTECGVWIRNPAASASEKTVNAYYKGKFDENPAVFRLMLSDNVNWNNTFTNTSSGNPLWALPPVIAKQGDHENDPDDPAPKVIAITAVMPEGLYGKEDEINIVVYFNKIVMVNTSSGKPSLLLNTGSTSGIASYATGSCSSALTFIYQVQAGDSSSKLDYISSNALQLNKGTIQGADAADANLSLPQPGKGASLAAYKVLKVDARPPVIIAGQKMTVDAAAPVGTIIGAPQAINEGPAGELRNWKIILGNTGNAFSIDDRTGEIAVANKYWTNEEIEEYKLLLTVCDSINTSDPVEISIALVESVQDTLLFEPAMLYENKPAGTLAGLLTVTTGRTPVSYSLIQGQGDEDNNYFMIVGNELRTSQSLDYENRATYNIRVRATVKANHYDTTFIIRILDLNEPPTIDPIADQSACAGGDMQLLPLTGITAGPETKQCVTVKAVASRQDFFSQLIVIQDTSGNTALRYKLRPSASGNATVTITVKDTGGNENGGTDSVQYQFSVNALASPEVVIVANRETSLSPGETVMLTATSNLDIASFQWLLNETDIPAAQTANWEVHADAPGHYACEITSTKGCTQRSNSLIVVKAGERSSLLLYPNPAQAKTYLSFTGFLDQNVQLKIYNSLGVLMQSRNFWHTSNHQVEEINNTGYPAGTYFLELRSEQNNKIGTSRYVVSQ